MDEGEIWWLSACIVNISIRMLLIPGYEENNRWIALVTKISVDTKDLNGVSNMLLARTYKISDLDRRSTGSVLTKSCRIFVETKIPCVLNVLR